MPDLSENKLAPSESELDLRLALAAARFGTWSLDLGHNELASSAMLKNHFGVDSECAFSYQQLTDAVHPDDRERRARAIANSLATGCDYEIEYRIATPGGEQRWINIRAQTVMDSSGHAVRMTGISQDVTERMNQDLRRQALADLGECINQLTEPVDLAVAACEILARALGVSRAGYGLIDPRAEIITIERDWNAPGVKSLAGVLHFREYGSYIEDLKRGETVVVTDAELDPRTAGTADALKAISAQSFINMPVREEGGLVALLYLNHVHARSWSAADIALVREVAARTRTAEARRRAEINLRVLSDSLEQEVLIRTQTLVATEEALRQAQKMEAVGQLTGGVAHDFNNLLTVVRSSVDLLRRDNLTEARRQRYVEAISTTVDRAARLTGQLLAFARRQSLQPEVFDGRENVRAIADMIGTLVGSRVQVLTDFPDTQCLVLADPNQFDTALVNMVANARDAMGGEGQLRIKLAAVEQLPLPHTGLEPNGRFIALSISDTGSGIEAQDLGRIFEPFFTTKAFGMGTGLGLSQVFGFAKQSNGDVRVVSAPGEGATFTLYLPQATTAVTPNLHPDDEALVDGHGELILVVEDNADVGAFAAEILQELGYRTVWADSAEAALAELRRQPGAFSAVFSDVVMAGMSGIELARLLRQRMPALPVILASGYSHVLAQQGVDGFDLLHKPYSVKTLAQRLAQAIRGGEARQ